MNNPGFYKFPKFTVAVYFTYSESIIVYRSTRRACSLSKTFAFGNSEPLLLLRLNGRVGAIPTYRVYRLYDTYRVYRLYDIGQLLSLCSLFRPLSAVVAIPVPHIVREIHCADCQMEEYDTV